MLKSFMQGFISIVIVCLLVTLFPFVVVPSWTEYIWNIAIGGTITGICYILIDNN